MVQSMNRFWTSLAIIFALGITWAWAQSSSVLRDDFTCASYEWIEVNDDGGHITCENDQQHIFIQVTGGRYRYLSVDLADVVVEVDAFKLSGKASTALGLVCRLKSNSFYAFFYSPETLTAGIYKFDRGEWQNLGFRNLSQDTMTNLSNAANRLRAECIGERLSLLINKQPVLTTYESDFRSGDVGLYASGEGSKREPVEVAFDNLEIFNAGKP
jgi:hypothetical protein